MTIHRIQSWVSPTKKEEALMRLLRLLLLLLLPSLSLLIVPRAGECISTEHDTVRQGRQKKKSSSSPLLLLLLVQGAAAAAAAAAAHSALRDAHMDVRGSRPRCPLAACTHLIERREKKKFLREEYVK